MYGQGLSVADTALHRRNTGGLNAKHYGTDRADDCRNHTGGKAAAWPEQGFAPFGQL